MAESPTEFTVSLAVSDQDLQEAQALRYAVFVTEMGANGAQVDHSAGLEKDRFDDYCDHMIIREKATGTLVGVYRLMRDDQARHAGGFYSETEYDLAPLTGSGRRLLELGRSCLHPEFRGGKALFYLWSGLNDYVVEHSIEVLFGTASFAGTDQNTLAGPLTLLNQNYLAPAPLRCRSRNYQPMDLLPVAAVDRKQAMVDCPALIKAYLRLGGMVGDGAFVDHAFNTTDVLMILDTARMSARQKRLYNSNKA